MPQNTKWFSAYLRQTRERRGWSQQQVADAGGPYRQLQAGIENNDETDVRINVLDALDRAYRWPPGYAEALAELGEYADDPVLPDALRGNDRDAIAATSYGGQSPPPQPYKTFAGLYTGTSDNANSTILGFEPTTGNAVFVEGPILTNISFDHLHAMIQGRHGVTAIDVTLLTETSTQAVRDYASGQMMDGVGQNKLDLYRVGTPEPGHADALIISPLAQVRTLEDAKNLVGDLLTIRPEVPTTLMRAAFTLLAVIAFGEDPLTTLTQLRRGSTDNSAREFAARFAEFWSDFYDPSEVGAELAHPDPYTCDLFAGIFAARAATMQVELRYPTPSPQARPKYRQPRTVEPAFLNHDRTPNIVFYDGNVIPELPTLQSYGWPTEVLTFHRVEIDGTVLRPQLGNWPHRRIGITAADDGDVLLHHQQWMLGTLTNYVAGQAIYCEAGRARRVWIPQW